jgi:SAM-dependent methyltransferase
VRPDFHGEVADYYARYRRGYPPAVLDVVADAFGLGSGDVVMDLGCGTGQLSLPLAARVRAVVGVDPEPDMLALAARAATGQGTANATWVLGTDRDLPALGALLGDRALAAVTIAVAIHWMDRDALLRAARPLLRPGGGIAVVTNGTPLWSQDTDWSRTARECLERWLGRPLGGGSCQTDDEGRRLNRDALVSAGYRVVESFVDYDAPLSVEELAGGLFSAMSADQLPPPAGREEFVARMRDALRGQEPLTERVRVSLQFGHLA